MAETRKHSTLGQVEFFKLATWLQSRLKEFEEHQTTYAESAASASEELSFSVTEDNIKNCATKLGLRWTQKKLGGSVSRKVYEEVVTRVMMLERSVGNLHQITEHLAQIIKKLEAESVLQRGAVVKLYHDLGNVPPPGYPMPPAPPKHTSIGGR